MVSRRGPQGHNDVIEIKVEGEDEVEGRVERYDEVEGKPGRALRS